MPRVEILRNVSDADVDSVIADYESIGCTAEKESEPDGDGWKVTATCPDGD